MNKVKVLEVIDTKEMLPGEFIDNYFVIYEEIENKQFDVNNNYYFVKDHFVEKNITLFKGSTYSTLRKIKVYPIKSMDVRLIRETIFKDFPSLFKKIQFTSKAV
ncbi:hypothetical protein V7654_19090 [Bacillus sp. JJ1609]|uniref:hypothetical protein n=1 Tax=Bacillus sp. JJ1609 TaxID=3122977 RepID=UPI002FFF164F